MMAALAQAIQLLADTLNNLTKSKYTSVAGLTVVLHDILLLTSDEVRLVWQSPRMNASRYCYLIDRYVPPLYLIVANYHLAGFRGSLTDTASINYLDMTTSNIGSVVWISTASLAQVVTGMAVTYILVLRVIALYGTGRAFKAFLYGLFLASYGVCLGITILAVKVIKEEATYSTLAKVCAVESMPPIFRGIFIAPVFFEVIIGVLTLWKAVQHAYVSSNASAAPMLHIMFRGGLFWFTAVVGLQVWNATIWVFLPQSMISLGIYILWGLVSTFVSRFFPNILTVANAGVDGFSEDYTSARTKRRAAVRTIGGSSGKPNFVAMTDFSNATDEGTYWRDTILNSSRSHGQV